MKTIIVRSECRCGNAHLPYSLTIVTRQLDVDDAAARKAYLEQTKNVHEERTGRVRNCTNVFASIEDDRGVRIYPA